mmetsp:Transcript_51973/g.136637  ORF Transcript_51973/g.136637 Transcript_51973/m.136637 type:complete len:281 (-) Transcript_51973:7-849(-)
MFAKHAQRVRNCCKAQQTSSTGRGALSTLGVPVAFLAAHQQAISKAAPSNEHTNNNPVQMEPAPGLTKSRNLSLSGMESARDKAVTAQTDVRTAQMPASSSQALMAQASRLPVHLTKLAARATEAHTSARTAHTSPITMATRMPCNLPHTSPNSVPAKSPLHSAASMLTFVAGRGKPINGTSDCTVTSHKVKSPWPDKTPTMLKVACPHSPVSPTTQKTTLKSKRAKPAKPRHGLAAAPDCFMAAARAEECKDGAKDEKRGARRDRSRGGREGGLRGGAA